MTAACVRSSIDSRRCSNVRSYGARLFTAQRPHASCSEYAEEKRTEFISAAVNMKPK